MTKLLQLSACLSFRSLRVLCGLFLFCVPFSLAFASPEQCQPYGDYAAKTFIVEAYICTAPASANVGLFWGQNGQNFGSFNELNKSLRSKGQRLRYAVNGGMYHKDRRPVGLFVSGGEEMTPLQIGASYGNFGLVPNGVFFKRGDSFDVMETRSFKAAKISPDFATQSGPMLIINGEYHPKFRPASMSKRIRNGVAVSPDGRLIYFVKSEVPMNFYDFAAIFKDQLKVHNALYLDGTISRMFDVETGRNDPGASMGPIIGVVQPLSKPTVTQEIEP